MKPFDFRFSILDFRFGIVGFLKSKIGNRKSQIEQRGCFGLNLIIAALSLLIISGTACAESFKSSARGTATAQFLRLGPGARPAALGEAYTALVDEASALYWNPAGLARITNDSLTLMHAAYIESSFFDYAAYSHNLGKWGAVGIGAQYFSSGKITQTNESGVETGQFTPNDLAVSLGYARQLTKSGFSLGIAGKFVRSTIIDSAQTWAGDAGMLSPPYLSGKLRLALTASNLGGKMKFDVEKEDLPVIFKVGSAFQASPSLAISLDAGFPKDDKSYTAVGLEYGLPTKTNWRLIGRAGYNTRTSDQLDDLAGASFGIGLTYRGFSLDYGFVPFGSLGTTHRISLTLLFEPSRIAEIFKVLTPETY